MFAHHQNSPSAKRKPNEIPALTSLRGFLALWIVLYHFWGDVLRLYPRMSFVSPFVRIGNMAVPAFFLLSGFVLSYNYADRFYRLRRREFVRFLLLRLARIYPVHFFTLLVVLAMIIQSNHDAYKFTASGYTARDFILNLLLMQTWVPYFSLNWNYPAWSISSEWFAYLIFPLTVSIGLRHLTTPSRAMVVTLLTIIGAVAILLWWPPWPFYELVLVLPMFFAGASAYWVLRERIDTGRSVVWRWTPDILVLFAMASTFATSTSLVLVSLLVCSLALLMALAWLGKSCNKIWSAWPAVFLGEISYSLYMTHTLAQKMVYRLFPTTRFVTAAPLSKIGITLLYAALITVWCLVTYYLVERPSREFLKRIK